MEHYIKRVALDFSWPLAMPWKGYINPYAPKPCECGGSGRSPYAQRVHDMLYGYVDFHPSQNGSTPLLPTHPAIVRLAKQTVEGNPTGYKEMLGRVPGMINIPDVYAFQKRWGVTVDLELFRKEDILVRIESIRLAMKFNGSMSHHLSDEDVKALVDDDRLREFTCDLIQGQGWVRKEPAVVPSAAEVNERSVVGFLHDSINLHVVVRARCERANEPVECPKCEGEGEIWPEEHHQAYEGWKPEEPPKGEGFQFWVVNDEGLRYPVSTVFSEPEKLAAWMVDRLMLDARTYDDWLAIIHNG